MQVITPQGHCRWTLGDSIYMCVQQQWLAGAARCCSTQLPLRHKPSAGSWQQLIPLPAAPCSLHHSTVQVQNGPSCNLMQQLDSGMRPTCARRSCCQSCCPPSGSTDCWKKHQLHILLTGTLDQRASQVRRTLSQHAHTASRQPFSARSCSSCSVTPVGKPMLGTTSRQSRGTGTSDSLPCPLCSVPRTSTATCMCVYQQYCA